MAVAWILRSRPVEKPADRLEALIAEVARKPAEIEPRAGLALYLREQSLAFGEAMELRLLPSRAPVEGHVAAARRFAELGLAEQATEIYQQLAARASNPDLTVQLAASLRQEGEFLPALAALDAALARFPENLGLQRERFRALVDAGDYPAALTTGEQLLPGEPAGSDLRPLLAWACLRQGNAAGASLLLGGLVDRRASPWTEIVRGRALLALGGERNHRAAQQAFERAAAAAPNRPEAFLGLADIAARRRLWAQVVPAAQRAVDLQPASARGWELLARASQAQGRPPEANWSRGCAALADERPAAAVALLQRAMEARHENRFVMDLVRACFAADRDQDALSALAREASRHPDPDLLRYWFGAAFSSGHLTDALQATRAMADRPDRSLQSEGLASSGQVLRVQGKLAEAEAAFTAALERAPGEPTLLAERGRTRLASRQDPRQLGRAEDDLRQALSRSDRIPSVYHDLAVISLEQGRSAEAFGYLLRQLALLQNRGLALPLTLLTSTCARLGLQEESRWCAGLGQSLQEAESRVRQRRSEIVRNATPGSYRELGDAALATRDLVLARGAYLRAAHLEPGRAENWLRLAKACQRMELIDERAEAMERYRRLTMTTRRSVER
jgi:tetratricopeptide (TPR) repeat protein